MSVIILSILFAQASSEYKLPDNLLSSLCYIESNHKINAYHKDDGISNSVGICQIKLSTAKTLGFEGTEKQLMEPKNNIFYAAAYLNKQRSRYKGSVSKAVISYNIGNAKGLTSSKYQIKVFKRWMQISHENSTCGPEKSH